MKHHYFLNLVKVLLLLAVMTCLTIVEGQNLKYYPYDTVIVTPIHNEFGISLYSQPNFEYLSTFVNLPENKSIYWWTIIFASGYDTSYSNPNYVFSNTVSFFYKFHWKQNGFRLAYSSNSLSYENDVDSTHWNATIAGWYSTYKGNYQMQKFSIGYERNYKLWRLDLYYALDLAYYWGVIDGSAIKHYGTANSIYSSTNLFMYNINLKEYSLAPSLGIRYNFWKICALSSEINLNFLYSTAKDSKAYYPSYSRFKIYTNPLSLFSFSLYI